MPLLLTLLHRIKCLNGFRTRSKAAASKMRGKTVCRCRTKMLRGCRFNRLTRSFPVSRLTNDDVTESWLVRGYWDTRGESMINNLLNNLLNVIILNDLEDGDSSFFFIIIIWFNLHRNSSIDININESRKIVILETLSYFYRK